MHRKKGTPNTPQVIIDEIVSKYNEGSTAIALSKEYGRTHETIKSMIKREKRKSREINNGKLSGDRKKGRKPAVTLREYKYENKRLKMENELLRDFLRLAGRM